MSTPDPAPAPPAIDAKARRRLERHFHAMHWTPYPELLVMAGIITFVIGVLKLDYLLTCVLLAIVLAGTGRLWSYWRRLYVASQKEFDHIAETDYAGIQQLALKRFELAPSDLRHADPCKFRSATKRDITKTHALVAQRTGSDEKVRRTPMEYLVINFGHAELFVYRAVWDLAMGAAIIEESHEFSYRDIVCVELTHNKETIKINLNTRLVVPLWKTHGIEPVGKYLQVPTDESVSLRLAQGEVMELFAWKRSGAGVPSGEGIKAHATAQRLQKLVRELKQPSAAPVPQPDAAPAPEAPRALPTIRHMRTSSQS